MIAPNKSPEPTPINREQASIGAVSPPRKLSGFSIAVHAVSRRWLPSSLLASYAEAGSFLR
jgi:hypothetical protein